GSGGVTFKSLGSTADAPVANAQQFVLSGANTFTGGVNITAGTVGVLSDAAFGDSANAINIIAGGLNVTATMSLPATRAITLGGAADRFIRVLAGQTLTINGSITGTGNLRKIDTGTLVL